MPSRPTYLSRYRNFHCPYHFPTEFIDKKGKRRNRYRYEDRMTSYEKLTLLSEAADDLKSSMSFSHLDAIASEYSDHEAANRLNEARTQLFQRINKFQQYAT